MIKQKKEEEIIKISQEYGGNNEKIRCHFIDICTKKAVERSLKNLWHDAQSDDLPEIDREVIVLCNDGKVCFGHRPNPNGWNGKNIITGEVSHYIPQIYDKGGWNIPDVKWWLDIELPKEE